MLRLMPFEWPSSAENKMYVECLSRVILQHAQLVRITLVALFYREYPLDVFTAQLSPSGSMAINPSPLISGLFAEFCSRTAECILSSSLVF